MSFFDGHTITLQEAALLYPLFKEIEWLRGLGIEESALRITIGNGNVDDKHVKSCIGWIKGGGYRRYTSTWDKMDDTCIQRQLDIAEALLVLTPEVREMAIGGHTMTKRVSDALESVNWDEYSNAREEDRRDCEWFLQNATYYDREEEVKKVEGVGTSMGKTKRSDYGSS